MLIQMPFFNRRNSRKWKRYKKRTRYGTIAVRTTTDVFAIKCVLSGRKPLVVYTNPTSHCHDDACIVFLFQALEKEIFELSEENARLQKSAQRLEESVLQYVSPL